MTAAPPLRYTFEGGVMVPAHPKLAAQQFGEGEVVTLERREARSANSHRHYFACINEAWQNLPEHLALLFPSAEHLRKYCLIKAGYCNEMTIRVASKAEAVRSVVTVRALDTFCVAEARDSTVFIWTAKSQSMRAMGAREFQESKSKVLDALAALIGVERQALEHNAGKAA